MLFSMDAPDHVCLLLMFKDKIPCLTSDLYDVIPLNPLTHPVNVDSVFPVYRIISLPFFD